MAVVLTQAFSPVIVLYYNYNLEVHHLLGNQET